MTQLQLHNDSAQPLFGMLQALSAAAAAAAAAILTTTRTHCKVQLSALRVPVKAHTVAHT
jgi:hypothetical protein